ncbi:ATP-NAD kinase-like domain-containing protein [Podospora didyma]|uniref:ATP-NAD kinase-like domain-containing protein n=1 Tax=Podospora didyma TaxID=330526 RepID=A0AAE0NYU5_9PEZI|nr:ATP-NAD kinase-like domain-containing protein [Podospora didyma]
MAVHMPRNAGDTATSAGTFNDAAPVIDELVLAAPNGDINESFTREEVIFIRKAPKASDGYLIYSLAEVASPKDDKPFKLSVLLTPQLPEGLLAEFLLDEIPAHLQAHANKELHVIVSTRSGVGQAKPFYEDVLKPLLAAALGLSPQQDQEILGLPEQTDHTGPGPGGDTTADADNSSTQLRSSAYGYRVTVTQNSQTIREFARGLGADGTNGTSLSSQSGAAEPSRTIILLSGDGGVIDLLNGSDISSKTKVTSNPPTVALLPLGTGNALFHSLHKPHYTKTDNVVPSPLVLSLRTLFNGTPATLPTFRASFSPRSHLVSGDAVPEGHDKPTPVDHLIGAIVASYGFHASLVWESDTPAYRKHGDKRFGMAAGELLKEEHAYDATVSIIPHGATSSSPVNLPRKKFNYVLAALVSNLEKTFTISPASKPLDGQLRLVHFGAVGGKKTMEIMMAAYRGGEHVGMTWKTGDGDEEDGVGYDAVDEVKVTIREDDPRWRKVCIDGTIAEVEKGGWMAVRKADETRLRVLVGR